MAIRGSLREASLPDVLQLLAMGKKTGCLSVTHRNNFGNIYFNKGRISYASIVNRRDRLGEMLVKQGALTLDTLHDAIKVQIQEAVYFLFTWNQGTFNFEPDVVPDLQDITVSINPESLLLEGAHRVDEWGLIEKKVPSFDIVFEVDRLKLGASDVALSDEQRVVIVLIDGARDVQRIIDESGLVEFEVGRALYGLTTAGFVHRIGRSAPEATAATEGLVEEHRNLGVAFYKTGMLDEAVREFRRVLELRGSDRVSRFYVGLVLARQ